MSVTKQTESKCIVTGCMSGRLHTDAAGKLLQQTKMAKAVKMQKEEIDHGKSFI